VLAALPIKTTTPPPPGVTISQVIQKDVPIHQEWVGTMAGNVDADIRPKVEGFLLARLYTEGSYVEKGQPMFNSTSASRSCCRAGDRKFGACPRCIVTDTD